MSTITTLLNTDSGSVSLGVINANFAELEADKIEASQTVTLTNKTIDADLNTIQDLGTANFKTANKSGLDTTVITGTKGDTNELAKWNVDGDLVTTDVSITTDAPSSSSTNSTIPTSAAVNTAITSAVNTTKEFFVPIIRGSDATLSVLGTVPYTQLDSGDVGYFSFLCPNNFTTLTSVDLIIYPDATETLQMDVVVNIAGAGEAYNIHTTTVSNTQLSVTVDQLTFWNLNTLAGTPFAPMLANDLVTLSITSDTTLSRVIGIRVRYV